MKYLVLIPAVLHIYIFWLETWGWGHPTSLRVFGVAPESSDSIKPWAFNQGWYNLFLGLAAIIGLFCPDPIGVTLVSYALGSMVAAALVLIVSSPGKVRSAAIQGTPALVGMLCFWLGK